jgi:mRNA-degrading endonuclease RelE of RelBE toxin-antitoxin system
MYEIEFSDDALQDLKSLKKNEQNEVLDDIDANLRHEPAIERHNRKRLRPNQTAEWELRIGKFRVFYDVYEAVKIVSIEAVGLKIGSLLRFRGKERPL